MMHFVQNLPSYLMLSRVYYFLSASLSKLKSSYLIFFNYQNVFTSYKKFSLIKKIYTASKAVPRAGGIRTAGPHMQKMTVKADPSPATCKHQHASQACSHAQSSRGTTGETFVTLGRGPLD